jgi:arylsulfatase A-like enzyme
MPSQKLLRPPLTDHLPEDSISLAEAIHARGYATAHIGKWHLGGAEYGPEKNGFDVNIGGTQAGSPTGGYFNFAVPSLKLEPGEYLTDRLTTEAIHFIDQHKDRPFFVYLAHYAVHIPLQAKEEVTRRYRGVIKNDAVHTNPLYAAMIESVDDSVGAIVKTLEDLKLLENSIVIFTSDNGGLSVREGPNTPATSNAPLRGGKGYLYEGGIRVPLIVRWPARVTPGSTCDVPVMGSDLYATLVAAADAKGNKVLDADNLLPLLRQQNRFRPRSLYWHYPHYSNQGGKPSSAIREGDWKLIEFFEDSRKELYNLKDDPREQHDLSANQPQKTKELAAKLNRWQTQVGAKMPTANPDYRAD